MSNVLVKGMQATGWRLSAANQHRHEHCHANQARLSYVTMSQARKHRSREGLTPGIYAALGGAAEPHPSKRICDIAPKLWWRKSQGFRRQYFCLDCYKSRSI